MNTQVQNLLHRSRRCESAHARSKWSGLTFAAAPLLALLAFLTFNLQLSAQTWTQLSPTGSTPPGRDNFSTVYNPTTHRMIVFGGQLDYQSVPTLGNDVWVLANADGIAGTPGWIQLSPGGTPPSARSFHSAVYNAASNRMIVFGGDPQVGYCYVDLNDVWVLTNADGTTGAPGWVQLSPGGTPPGARAHYAIVYDSANNRMILFGGNNECGSMQNDVCVLSHADGLGGTPAWTQLSPTGGPPAGRSSLVTGYDPANDLLIIFGGGLQTGFTNDVWTLSNANGLGGTPVWTQLTVSGSTPPRANADGVYDSGNNTLLVFGGDTTTQTNDVWELSNANGLGGTPTWTRMNPSGGPPESRDGAGAIYNSTAGRLIVYGGITSGTTLLSDVWVLDFPPSLNIATVGNQSVLFWPASATNYVLQSSTNLASTNWVNVSNSVPVNAVTVTNQSPALFFRLNPN